MLNIWCNSEVTGSVIKMYGEGRHSGVGVVEVDVVWDIGWMDWICWVLIWRGRLDAWILDYIQIQNVGILEERYQFIHMIEIAMPLVSHLDIHKKCLRKGHHNPKNILWIIQCILKHNSNCLGWLRRSVAYYLRSLIIESCSKNKNCTMKLFTIVTLFHQYFFTKAT